MRVDDANGAACQPANRHPPHCIVARLSVRVGAPTIIGAHPFQHGMLAQMRVSQASRCLPFSPSLNRCPPAQTASLSTLPGASRLINDRRSVVPSSLHPGGPCAPDPMTCVVGARSFCPNHNHPHPKRFKLSLHFNTQRRVKQKKKPCPPPTCPATYSAASTMGAMVSLRHPILHIFPDLAWPTLNNAGPRIVLINHVQPCTNSPHPEITTNSRDQVVSSITVVMSWRFRNWG
jgi:hypothetical protein